MSLAPSPTPTRSPLRQDPLRAPGQSTLQRLHEDVHLWLVYVATWAVITALAAAAEWAKVFLRLGHMPYHYTAIALTFIGVTVVAYRRGVVRAKALRLGAAGEQTVAEVLAGLAASGYRAFHDLPSRDRPGSNIDHVLVGPAGVIVIETKTRSKPNGRDARIQYDGQRVILDGRLLDGADDPVAQARAAAQEVRRYLEQTTGASCSVRGVVLFPGWYVTGGSGAEVWVLNPNALAGWIAREPQRSRRENVALIAERLGRWSRDAHRA